MGKIELEILKVLFLSGPLSLRCIGNRVRTRGKCDSLAKERRCAIQKLRKEGLINVEVRLERPYNRFYLTSDGYERMKHPYPRLNQ